MKALAGQYQSARNQVEREEKRMLVQAGINIQDRVFTSEELAGKLVTERRKFQLGVCEVSGDCSPDSTLLSMLQQSKARGKAWCCPQTLPGMRLGNYQLLCTLLCMSYSTC